MIRSRGQQGYAFGRSAPRHREEDPTPPLFLSEVDELDEVEDYDEEDAEGEEVGEGTPDNYFAARNGEHGEILDTPTYVQTPVEDIGDNEVDEFEAAKNRTKKSGAPLARRALSFPLEQLALRRELPSICPGT